MADLNTAKAIIEKLVQNKKTSLASTQIQKFYNLYGHKADILFVCCDWYRRLGQYQKGIALLKINSSNLKIALSTANKEGRKILWFARLSNLLGAPTIAKRLIANITAASPEDHRIFGLIHLTNFSYEMAYVSFQKVVRVEPAVKTYQSRMDLLNYADSLIGIKKFNEALELNRQLLTQSESDFETALLNQAVGETHCAMENWDQALIYLQRSEQFYTKKSTNIDLAFLQKWIGLCHYRLGSVEKGHTFILKSVNSLVKLSAKEDALLLSLDFASQFNSLNINQKNKLNLIKSIFYKHDTKFTDRDQIGVDSASIKINWQSAEIKVTTKNKTAYDFEFNKEFKLIVFLSSLKTGELITIAFMI